MKEKRRNIVLVIVLLLAFGLTIVRLTNLTKTEMPLVEEISEEEISEETEKSGEDLGEQQLVKKEKEQTPKSDEETIQSTERKEDTEESKSVTDNQDINLVAYVEEPSSEKASLKKTESETQSPSTEESKVPGDESESSTEESKVPDDESESSTEETKESEEETTSPTEPEKHVHVYKMVKEECIYNENNTHTIEKTYECTCGEISKKSQLEDCQYGEWVYIENATDEHFCMSCRHSETRSHEHEEPDSELEYVCKSPNNDGTHKMELSYTCKLCSEVIYKYKNETCEYVTTYARTGVNDTHTVMKDCEICGEHLEEKGTCVPTGDLKLVKIYAQIYEYYDCELCGDMCKRQYHVNHVFEPWEYRDSMTHMRYCICVEERQKEYHDFEYPVNSDGEVIQSDILTCAGCSTTKTVPWHDHKKGAKDNMGLMDIVLNKTLYNELLDTTQIANPNPSPDSYCSLYILRCGECGEVYTITYDHSFDENGICTRKGYCGGISRN